MPPTFDDQWKQSALPGQVCDDCQIDEGLMVPVLLDNDDLFKFVCKKCWADLEYGLFVQLTPLDEEDDV